MKILIGVTLANQGGTQIFVYQLAKWLQKNGHEVTVMCGPGDWLPAKLTELTIPWIRLKHMVRNIHPWHDAVGVLEIKHLVKQLKPDAVHLNSSKMGAVGSVGAKLGQAPKIIYCIGGWVFLESLSTIRKWIYTLIERHTARFKDWIINLYPGDLETAQRLRIKPKHELVVIPNGIDVQTLEAQLIPRSEARSYLSKLCKTTFDDQSIIFGTIANFFPQKELTRYIHACGHVVKQLPNARFIILGEGPEREKIEHAIQEKRLDSYIFLPGSVEQASRYLKAFDAHVLTSSKEGMPFTILEAMAAQIPCLATDVGAMRWMLNTHGWIIEEPTEDGIAETMLAFANQETNIKKQKTDGAYHEVVTRFQLDHQMSEHERILSA